MSGHRIKILFAIGTLELGGAERQLVELASRLDSTRFDPIVCVLSEPGPLGSVLRARGVKVYYLGLKRPQFRFAAILLAIRTLARLWRMIRIERPLVFHGVLFTAYVMGTLAAGLARVPIIVASRRSLGLFKAGKPHYLFLERLTNRMTDLVIANSDAVRRDAIRQEGLDPKRIIVIYNGLDPHSCVGADESVRRDFELGSGPVIAVVANFIEYKGHKYFFDAWRNIVAHCPHAVAVLVGDGATRPVWERWCQQEGLASSVRFVGVRQDVPRILAAADIYVHPSLQEGYSNAVLEAMAASLPIVATAVGGNVEAIEHERTGLLVPAGSASALASAVNRLLADPRLARRLGAAARSAVEGRHHISRMVREYEHVYERLVASSVSNRRTASYVWDRGSV